MPITGTTQIFPIIGHPVSGVFSPPAFNLLFQDRGLDIVMVPMDVPVSGANGFWDVLRASANMIGCSVTYPHKQAAFAAMDECTPRAARLGAVNTVRCKNGRLIGDATDGLAMCAAIHATGIKIKDGVAHILGAGGGAGIAIVDALCENGISELVLAETNDARAQALQALLAEYWPDVPLSQSAGPCPILINATTLGKSIGDPVPFSSKDIESAALVCDVITRDTPTALCETAQMLNRPIVSGQQMGQCQLEMQLRFLLG
ncbi:MAG: shikimate dehydrogenase family protein [Pelagimonas sp.]|uniref:shikimate dehydrogenase family protein n=1 Tax=Pelagimonas sp. TaxID=2073170 RepID=UPI003D6A5596